ncbi:MAG TPA: sialidase family protein [Solirubrobacterales bacterium]|nr:sialidase family protein [Solirubrobacterales bacterium]
MRSLARGGTKVALLLCALSALATPGSAAAGEPGGGSVPSTVDCTVAGGEANVNLDCPDQMFPVGEPHVAVDPRDPRHIVATAMNDAECCIQFSTSFDAGKTWTTGSMSSQAPPAGMMATAADTSVAFDHRHRTVVHASLSALVNESGEAGDFDVVANVSEDGGQTWGAPVLIKRGEGFGDPQEGNDKPWITSDTNPSSRFYGRLYVTWDEPVGTPASFAKTAEPGPVLESHSDDGGRTWSKPQVISGASDRYCTYTGLGSRRGRCDRNTFSFPAVAPDGTVYVAFANLQNKRAWERGERFEDQYLVVRSENGGRSWKPPRHVVNMEDGTRDYPTNSSAAQVLSGFQFAVTAFGNLAADPDSGRLHLVFSDNRAGRTDSPNPVTRTDVFVVSSRDGKSWSRARRISRRGGTSGCPSPTSTLAPAALGSYTSIRARKGATSMT